MLAGTSVGVAVIDISEAWLTDRVSDRASGFLATVTTSALTRGVTSLTIPS